MAENKKFYWLKLKRDFFKRHDVRIIEEMPNGRDYVLFYLKLLLESIDHEGELRFSETIPYNEQMLSVVTNTNIDIVRAALSIFTELKMIEVYDDMTIYMNEVQKLIGSETAAAARKRKSRQNQKILAKCDNVQTECDIVQKCHTEIEKENREQIKRIDKEDREKSQKEITDLFNSLCPSLSQIKYLSEETKTIIEKQLEKYTLDDFKLLFQKAEASDFLKGENERKWAASFEWLIEDQNMAKVLNGNFDNRKSLTDAFADNNYDHAALERMSRSNPVFVKGNPELEKKAAELKEKLQESYN